MPPSVVLEWRRTIRTEDLVPVTARLSRRFYEQFGDEVANELVEWFNAVDATYKADLRELNELNFARFDAKVGQRFAEFEAKLEHRFADSEANWERRFAELDAKWERRFAELDAKWERRVAALKVDFADRLAAREVRLVGWMFGFWSTSIVALYSLLHTR
jgi:hypothetical protein